MQLHFLRIEYNQQKKSGKYKKQISYITKFGPPGQILRSCSNFSLHIFLWFYLHFGHGNWQLSDNQVNDLVIYLLMWLSLAAIM